MLYKWVGGCGRVSQRICARRALPLGCPATHPPRGDRRRGPARFQSRTRVQSRTNVPNNLFLTHAHPRMHPPVRTTTRR